MCPPSPAPFLPRARGSFFPLTFFPSRPRLRSLCRDRDAPRCHSLAAQRSVATIHAKVFLTLALVCTVHLVAVSRADEGTGAAQHHAPPHAGRGSYVLDAYGAMAADAASSGGRTMAAVEVVDGKCVLTRTRPVPSVAARELLVKVHWSAVNRADTLQRKGVVPSPPGVSDIIGLECSGIVEEVGADCELGFAVGDRIMALLAGGGYAEYVNVDERLVMRVPAGMDLKTAGAIPETWLTAYQLLHFVGKVEAGDTALVLAAGSGVGTAATQLAVHAGASVVAVAGAASKLETSTRLGAAATINYKEEDVGERALAATDGKGVQLVLDPVGASLWTHCAKALAMDGRWVLFGLMGGPAPEGPILGALLRKRVRLEGTTLRTRPIDYKERLVAAFYATASSKFEDGSFAPVVDSTFPLERTQEAHDHVESNASHGKVMLQVAADAEGAA